VADSGCAQEVLDRSIDRSIDDESRIWGDIHPGYVVSPRTKPFSRSRPNVGDFIAEKGRLKDEELDDTTYSRCGRQGPSDRYRGKCAYPSLGGAVDLGAMRTPTLIPEQHDPAIHRHQAGSKQIMAKRHRRHCIDDDSDESVRSSRRLRVCGRLRQIRRFAFHVYRLAFRRARPGASLLASYIPCRTIDDGVSMSLTTDPHQKSSPVCSCRHSSTRRSRSISFRILALLVHRVAQSLTQVFAWSLSGKGPTPPGHNLLDSNTICIIIILSFSFL
jgi:hypothetical protein